MKFYVTLILLVLAMDANAQQALQPVGLWREHLPYNNAIDITAAPDRIFCATPFSIFSINADNSIERWSRVTGLSETGISTIQFDEINNKLFIAYTNSNIDIISANAINNVPDIKRDNIIGDKSIYNISPLGKNYYLSTGLGVIVIDGDKYEVKESWFIGNMGNHVKVNGFTSDGVYYYAATEEGLKKALVNSSRLSDYSSWQLVGTANGLSGGACQNVMSIQSKILVQKNDSLFVQNGNSWNLFYTDGWTYKSCSVSANKILLCEKQNNNSRVVILNPDGTIARLIAQPTVISEPKKAIIYNNDPWVADLFGGLSHFTASSFIQYKPNSPEATASGEMMVYNSVFYATAGEVNSSWNYQYNGNGIFSLKDGEWINTNKFRYPQIDSLLDFITIAVDPADETIWAGSYGGGLLHVKTGTAFDIFKQNYIGPAMGDAASYRVSGLCFDKERNLWVANYGSAQPLRVRKADGSWRSFSIPVSLSENAVSQIVVDDNNYKWIVSPKGNGLLCYDQGASIDNTGDDHWRIFRGGSANGNLPVSNVLCIAKDKSGFIWAGTTDGIGVIQCTADVFTANGCEAVLPIVQQGNFANYLFKGEEVRSIAVDGADRKWVATKNGVWLINATGEKVIYQFTETNSPLLSSDVKKIAIDGNSGEVFFATQKGICSFRSTATEGADKNSDILVFPNPVPPGYSGTIAIRGVANNAIVKITELDGRLIYQTRAFGGQAVWDGRDYKGRKIATGIYLVLISNDGRTEQATTKIIFVSK